MSKVLLVDATNLLMRAVYASRGQEMSADGVFTGGVVIFIKSLARFVREERPDRLAVCWDGGRSAMRTALYPAYKANRRDQPEDLVDSRRDTKGLASEFLSLCGVHHAERPGMEADDLIAAYWTRHRAQDDRVVILSSDKDFLMLLEPGTEQIRLSSAGTPTDRWDTARVHAAHGCLPRDWPAVLALAGDVSDNVPGVPRYGIKTAVKQLAKAGWRIDQIQDPRVVTARDQVEVNYRLVDLRNTPPSAQPAPLFRPTTVVDSMWGPLTDYLHRYRLETIRQNLYQGSLWSTPDVTDAAKIHPGVH